MALASIRTSVISRGKGKSSVAAAAYRSGEKLYNEREQRGYHYARKRTIAYTEIRAPANAPGWVYTRQTLWNEVENSETRCNSRTAREIRIALPVELTLEQNIIATRHYAQTFVNQGMIADVAIHNETGNPHAHIMLTTRAIDETGFGQKIREWDKKETQQKWHKEYETVINRHLELAGRPERIDIRSYAEQGLEKIPTIHLGHHSHELEQAGIPTLRGDKNREIGKMNQQLEEATRQLAVVEAALQKERETQANIERVDEMYRKNIEARRRPEPQPLTPEQVEEYQRRTAERRKYLEPHEIQEHYQRWKQREREYRGEPRRLLESEFANPERRKEEQQQGWKKEEEPQHHKPDTKPRKMSLEELDRLYREGAQDYNERRKRERERDGPEIPM